MLLLNLDLSAPVKFRPNRGLWSQFGRPYVANGEPDLQLADTAKRLRQQQRDKRSKKAVRHHAAPSRERWVFFTTPWSRDWRLWKRFLNIVPTLELEATQVQYT